MGMVHALEEAERVLRPGGLLVDIRPASAFGSRFLFQDPAGTRAVGPYLPRPSFQAECAAADEALRSVIDRELFSRVTADGFPMRVYFSSLDVIAAYHERGLDVLAREATDRLAGYFRDAPGGVAVREEDTVLNVLRRREEEDDRRDGERSDR